jgi:DNA (cytosine-5)-methyltransferase 1
MKKLRVASMFAGIGGICAGFQQAGCDIIWANEVDAPACRTYRHNFGGSYLLEGDIKGVNTASIPDFDILTAGFPCQSFSIGGKKKGFDDSRGELFFEVIRIIEAQRPKVVFLENVENLMEHDNEKTFLAIYNALVKCGYFVRYKVMPTNEYGNIPQSRKRIFIVAFIDYLSCDTFRYPEPIHLKRTVDDIINPTEKKNDIYYYKMNTQLYRHLNSFLSNNHRLHRVYNGKARNLRKPRLCPTITASMNSPQNAVVLRDAYGIRRLTLRETLDFQGFPNEYYFPKSISIVDAYRQIGNSVTVPVIKRIAENIVELLQVS